MAIVGSFASLAEAQLTTQSKLEKGVIPEVIREGGILGDLPVRQIAALNYQFNRENVLPSGGFHAIADTWVAAEDIDLTQTTVTLAIHGNQSDIDDFARRQYSNINDYMVVITQLTMRGLRNRVERALVYEATAFSGLHNLVTSAQTVSMGSGAVGAALAVNSLNRMVDLVRPKPDFLLMPYRVGQRMDQVGQGGSTSYPVIMISHEGQTSMGQMTTVWRDVPIRRSDYMATGDTGVLQETIASGTFSAETGGATGSIFGIHKGLPPNPGVFLVTGNPMFEMDGPNPSENKNSKWIRIRSYFALASGGTRPLGRVDGITDVAVLV